MRIGSLFSGIGGLELGLEQAGVGRTVWQVEIDPWCRGVLARNWPDAERFEDVRAVGAANLASVDLICGGFPCQDVSSAGLGAGIVEGTRSGLWIEYLRIVGEMRPSWVVVENVASGKAKWLCRVRGDLQALGYETHAFTVSAADVGAPHRRARIFVVGYAVRPRLEGVELARGTERWRLVLPPLSPPQICDCCGAPATCWDVACTPYCQACCEYCVMPTKCTREGGTCCPSEACLPNQVARP